MSAAGAPRMDAGGAAAAVAAHGGTTPAGNTGVEIALGQDVVGVGWLGLTAWVASVPAALAEIEQLLGELRPRSVATRGYTQAWECLDRSTVSISALRPGEVHVDLTQSDCERLGGRALRELVLWADTGQRWKCSRLDLNYDDRARVVDPLGVYAAFNRGDRVSHVQGAALWQNTAGGVTCYIGSPKSQQQLRVYDKDAERGERGHGVRWEWQGRDEVATEMLRVWFGIGDGEHRVVTAAEARELFWGRVRRFVDFLDLESAEHQEDRRPLSWWAELLEGASKMRPRVVQVVPASFLRSVAWMRAQVAPTLAAIVQEVSKSGHGGWDLLRQLVDDGDQRLVRRKQQAWAMVPV